MNTDNRDGWVLLKPEDYLAIPVSQFAAFISSAKNMKYNWSRSDTNSYSLSSNPMTMQYMTHEQMTAIAVLDRLTRASQPAESDAGCSTSAAS